MVGLFGLLPLLEGWTFLVKNKELEAKTVTKGSSKYIERWKGRGWLLSVYAYTSDPYMQLKLKVDDNELPSETIAAMNTYGETQPGGMGGYLLKYAAGYYSLQLINPNTPMPYRKMVDLNACLSSASSSATSDITVVSTYVEIIDCDKFLTSLAKIMKLKA